MYVVFLLLWIILNGQFTWEIFGVGAVISAALYWFICKFLAYSPGKDWRLLKKLPYIFQYVLVLLKEIIKANVSTIRMVLSYQYEIEPVLVKFRTSLKTPAARVILANSITLTPGTITIALEGDELTVHALDQDFARGLDSCVFVKLLTKMEQIDGNSSAMRK